MSKGRNDQYIPLFIAGTICSVIFFFFYLVWCAGSNYYDLANNCVKNGGSWVHQQQYDGVCLGSNKIKEKI